MKRDHSSRLRELRHDLLYRQAPAAINGNLFILLLAVVILFDKVNTRFLGIWSLALLATFALRYHFQRRRYWSMPVKQRQEPRWEWMFIGMSLLTGTLWGSAAFFIRPEQLPLELFMVLVVGGLIAFTTVTYSASLLAAPLFMISALLPYVVRFMVYGEPLMVAAGMLLLMLALAQLLVHWHAHRVTLDNLRLRVDNEILVRGTPQQRAAVTLHSISDGIITTTMEGRIDYLNPMAEKLLERTLSMVRGDYYLDVLTMTDETTGESLGDLVKLCLTQQDAVVHANNGLLHHADGSEYTIQISASPMRDRQGEMIGVVLVLHDVTELMGITRQLNYQASHDMLTGLINRHEFEAQLELAIRQARSSGTPYALFYMDLDQFKVVNDTCGHRAGDELLGQLAALLQKVLGEHDLVGRLGGDEFGVLLAHREIDDAVVVADDLRQHIKEFRFVWGDKTFDIGVSIGVVAIDARTGKLSDVLSSADAACYVAKEMGRNRIHLYHLDDSAVLKHHGEMEWIHRITQAFEEERFVLYCQPIMALDRNDDAISHYEVLMRLLDEKGRLIPPMAFVPAAERYNLMPTIDRWVVRTTLGLLRQAQGPAESPPIHCAINLSGQSLSDDNFLSFVIDQFEETGLPWNAICFEITETAAVSNLTRAMRFINKLRERGCCFSLDDFGSGLSSFGYLKNLHVDYLKIDGSFVRDMVRDTVDSAMVESINQIGHVLGLRTIAEFAENEAILQRLQQLGVDYAQGNAVGVPTSLVQLLGKLQPGYQRGAFVQRTLH